MTIQETIDALTKKRNALVRRGEKVAEPKSKAKYKGEAELLESAIGHLTIRKEPSLTFHQLQFLKGLSMGYLFRWHTDRAMLLISPKGKEYKYSRSKIDQLIGYGYIFEKDDYYKLTGKEFFS